MFAPLSIVIPTLNSAPKLPDTIACLMEGLDAALVHDLVITDAGSSDATQVIADELGATYVTGQAGRGGQLRRGAYAAHGDWLLFLHDDTHLPPGWATVVKAHLQNPETAAYFKLSFRAAGVTAKLFALGANLRSKFGLPYGDQGLLISRALYDELGGYQDIPLMEDVAMARALRGRMRRLNATVATGAVRYLHGGWWRRGGRNMWTLMRYACGTSPEKLSNDYNR